MEQHSADSEEKEQKVYRAESSPPERLTTTGNGHQAVAGAAPDGSIHGFGQTGSQNRGKAPLAVALER
ncbi:hypothetical protein MOD31_01705 [Paenarthrobacter sp. TYUT067]|uniref:hypothetical protein n=1 Tax=Paenarthrobacter sp. TYUT067 TaxID=2926245 RepID=UPI00202FEC8F|nr:hypothetical protein [Paenarthrobacter sp. TYUT067]MCM0614726.1 hypothetical protein [Paenarthrobacter sp. TYUT067]